MTRLAKILIAGTATLIPMTQAFAGASTSATTVSSDGVVQLGSNSGIGGGSLFAGGINAVSSNGAVDSGVIASTPAPNAGNGVLSAGPGDGSNSGGGNGVLSAGTSNTGSGTGNGTGDNASESEINNNQVNNGTVWN